MKEQVYIAHVCKNSLLNKKDKNYCENGFVDISPKKNTISEQCWKYCPRCEELGFPKITEPPTRELSEAQKNNIEKMHEGKRLKETL